MHLGLRSIPTKLLVNLISNSIKDVVDSTLLMIDYTPRKTGWRASLLTVGGMVGEFRFFIEQETTKHLHKRNRREKREYKVNSGHGLVPAKGK